MLVLTHKVVASGRGYRVVKAQSSDFGQYDASPNPTFGGDSDWQFQDGPGGVIYLSDKPNPSIVNKIVNWLKRQTGIGSMYKEPLEQSIVETEKEFDVQLGYYLSSPGSGENEKNEFLDGMATIYIGNITRDVLFALAKKLESKTRDQAYVEFFGTPGTIFTTDGQEVETGGPTFGGLTDGVTAVIIMSADKNERNSFRKLEVNRETGQPVAHTKSLSKEILQSSISGWLQTLKQRMGRDRMINDVVQDQFSPHVEVSDSGFGGYIERGGYDTNPDFLGEQNRERSFSIKVYQLPEKGVEKLARALAKKFEQYSVMVHFKNGEQKHYSGLLGQEGPTTETIASVYSRVIRG